MTFTAQRKSSEPVQFSFPQFAFNHHGNINGEDFPTTYPQAK